MGILRFLLAFVVVINHAGHWTHLNNLSADAFAMDGLTAVQSFFIISGFYMALVLNEKYNFAGATRLFYQQRFLRLAPTYWLVLVLVLAVCALFSFYAHEARGKFSPWAAAGALGPGTVLVLAAAQVSMLGVDVFSFCKIIGHPGHLQFDLQPYAGGGIPASDLTLIFPAWSISVELWFYLVAPLLVRRSVRAQLGVVALSFAGRISAGMIPGLNVTEQPWCCRFFPFEVGLFLLGSLGYRFLKHADSFSKTRGWLRWLLTGVFAAGTLLFYKIPLPQDVRHWLFLALVAAGVPLLFAMTRHDSIDRWIGEISYPLYLVHNIVIYALNPVLKRTPAMLSDAVVLLTPVFFAVLIFVFYERRCEAWRAKFFARKHPGPA